LTNALAYTIAITFTAVKLCMVQAVINIEAEVLVIAYHFHPSLISVSRLYYKCSLLAKPTNIRLG